MCRYWVDIMRRSRACVQENKCTFNRSFTGSATADLSLPPPPTHTPVREQLRFDVIRNNSPTFQQLDYYQLAAAAAAGQVEEAQRGTDDGPHGLVGPVGRQAHGRVRGWGEGPITWEVCGAGPGWDAWQRCSMGCPKGMLEMHWGSGMVGCMAGRGKKGGGELWKRCRGHAPPPPPPSFARQRIHCPCLPVVCKGALKGELAGAGGLTPRVHTLHRVPADVRMESSAGFTVEGSLERTFKYAQEACTQDGHHADPNQFCTCMLSVVSNEFCLPCVSLENRVIMPSPATMVK
jgi:hypothetical protein